MFEQSKHVSADSVKALQGSRVDPKTVAENLSTMIRRQLLLDETHPWAASNVRQAQLACLAIAYTNDRLAEIMMMEAMTKNRKGNDVLPPEIEQFVRELSELAMVRLQYAKEGLTFSGVEFDDETRQNLYIANNLPTFPEYPSGYECEEDEMPYGRSTTAGTVDIVFVRALNQAGYEIQGRAYTLANEIANSTMVVPALYSDLIKFLRDQYMYGAGDSSEYAETLMDMVKEGASNPTLLCEAYKNAYQGYVHGALAYIALHCPAVLGEQWVLDRTQL